MLSTALYTAGVLPGLKMSQKKLAARSPSVFKCVAMGQEVQIHDRIRIERETAGLSIAHCTRAMGWKTHKQWHRLEDGERNLKAEELVDVAAILGVTVARLVGEQPLVVPGYQKRGRRSGTSMGEGGDGGLGE